MSRAAIEPARVPVVNRRPTNAPRFGPAAL